jgi:phosphonate transport system ATP-binding protein
LARSNNALVIFELRDVSRQFRGFPALSRINLSIRAAESVALVGPSGAGKSTLINLLNGAILPTTGSVYALGQDLSRLSPRTLRQVQSQIGTIYQQFHLVNSLRVVHNVNAGRLGQWSFARALRSLFWPLEVETAARALTRVGIPEKLYERTGQLSGGQQQRVAIARVLVQNPQAILADEPISSLDPERSREIMDLLVGLSRQDHTTLVTSLHDIDFALSHFERIVGLRQGRILFDCPSQAITSDMIQALYHITP